MGKAAGFSRWLRAAGRGVLLLLLFAAGAAAQTPAGASSGGNDGPMGRFRRSAVRVGELVEYELSYRHAPELEVIFPDSAADFTPFEYVGRRYYPTRTRQGRSLDRAVYRLRTFALDSVQHLVLPVTVLSGHDTLLLPTSAAAVRLIRTAPTTLDGNPPVLRQNLQVLPVEPQFNYPYWLAGLGVALALVGGVVLGFRRGLRQRYRRYRLRKNHAYFLAQYARHVERFTLSRSPTNMERAITLWKNYLSTLEDNNITSLTTREIVVHYQRDADVSLALRLADRVIYGKQFSEDDTETDLAFELLRRFAERQYMQSVRGSGEATALAAPAVAS